MGIFDNELILPGTSTEIISDFDLGYDTSLFGTTDAVTIIGTAFNGPVGRPVEVYSPEHANYIFGEAYDYKTRREATLVASVKDAWEKGCKTIYAVRVSGKDIAKDFTLVPETKLKLRVSGLFPSNANKEISMVYDNTPNDSCIKIYKPAKRATIKEKTAGLVDRENSILETKIELFGSYGIDADSRLVDLIRIVNEYPFNNVIRLSIVDEKGNDVTIQSKEAQALSVGALFPGLYLIGRDHSKCEIATDVQYKLVSAGRKPYSTYEDKVYKELVLNTDVSTDYPIFGTLDALNGKFPSKVYMTELFDFLTAPGACDEVFEKDKIDYEEVELSDFDLYQRLGSGFAITAQAELTPDGDKIKRICETPSTDDRKIVPIHDGIYSMIIGLNSKYRVLVSGFADTKITGKLPRKTDFEISKPLSIDLKGMIDARAVVDAKDFTEPKTYKFHFEYVEDMPEAAEIESKLYIDKVAKAINVASEAGKTAIKENSLVAITGESTVLGRVIGGEIVKVNANKNKDMAGKYFFVDGEILESTISDSEIKLIEVQATAIGPSKTYVLVENASTVYIYKVTTTTLAELEAVGSIDEILNGDEDQTLITVEDVAGVENLITVKSNEFDYITIEELIEKLNKDETLSNLYTFTLKNLANKDVIIKEGFLDETTYDSEAKANKEKGFDASLRIPYRTTDNFARQLAQHCTYTSLKTAPTHGIIGCGPLMDINLTSVANKVNELIDLNLNLYAKKDNGRDMLDHNNLPYSIGRNVSIPLGQYPITTLDGYTHISNGAAGYAGMISALPIDQSSTNQPIAINNLMYQLTNDQLNRLTKRGYVTFKPSYTKGIVVTDGVTMETDNSPFKRLSTTRITGKVEELIRAAVEPFIGTQNNLANRNSMQTAIKSALDKIEGVLINKYEFRLVDDVRAERLGIIYIDYKFVHIYEIREVRNRIRVGHEI